MTITKRRNPTTIARVVVALVGVGCLLLTVQGAVQATGRGVALMSDREHDLPALQHQVDLETLWQQLVEQVPPGSRISLVQARANKDLWQQRLSELAVLHGCVVVQAGPRDYSVGVAAVQRKRPTSPGVRLVVRKVL
ncbi:hypothetical protein AB0C06_06855 [Micromonospora inaquosa]|uniref:Uncharacterized protein n=1 Tax=Micromonospora inaquosa TaxID=2203716 RepID=A0A3N9X0K4_9ACTN|nr:hypothetical protein [Micromonospora inaquosa]RQX06614.1 hypothetical protein DLJ59_04545 [Micromonospora inaquosa]